jgi:hypothetical protein
MANSYYTNPIKLDTFTSEINLATVLGGKYWYKLNYIKWEKPNAVNDTATVKINSDVAVFDEVCTTAKESIKEDFNGLVVPNIIIAISGVSSGKLEIGLM